MDTVADDLRVGIARHGGADDPGLAVMQRGHGVAGMGQAFCPRPKRRQSGFVIGDGVPQRHGGATGAYVLQSARKLRRNRDHSHVCNPLGGGGKGKIALVLRPLCLGGKEGTLQMKAKARI